MSPEEELPTTKIATTAPLTPLGPHQDMETQVNMRTQVNPTRIRQTGDDNKTDGYKTDDTKDAAKKTDDDKESEDEEEKEKDKFLGLKPTQVVGGIFASSTAAILGGQLGVAGTVAGAALTSFTIVVGGAIYTRAFDRTKDGLGSAVTRLRVGGTPPATGPTEPEYAEPIDDPTRVIAAQAEAKDEVESDLRWYQRIALVKVLAAAAGLFLIAAVVVTGLESIRGSSVSGGDGTTIGQISRGETGRADTGGDGTTDGRNGDTGTVTEPTTVPSPTTTDEPTTTEPTTDATSAPTTEPEDEPATDPTTGPTTAPTTGDGAGSETGSDTEAGTSSGTGSGSGTDSATGPGSGAGSGTDSRVGSGVSYDSGPASETGASGTVMTEG